MRRGAWAIEIDRLRAESWEGVISARDLVRLGVPERTVYRRCLDDGPWTLLLPATILLSSGEATPRELEIAALVHAGEHAMLTGLGGARHYGIRRGHEPAGPHVLVPITHQIQGVGSVRIERTRRLPDPGEREGLRVAPLARCLLDHVRTMKDETAIAALLTEAVQRRMLLPEMLLVELDRASRKGTAAPRRVLEAVSAGVESPAEFEALTFWRGCPGLPDVQCNVPVLTPAGEQIAVVDFLVDEVGFVWEIDSVEEHFATPEQVRRTLERRRALLDVGLYVVSTRPAQRRDDPAGVLSDIRHGLAIAAAMPPARVLYGAPPAA